MGFANVLEKLFVNRGGKAPPNSNNNKKTSWGRGCLSQDFAVGSLHWIVPGFIILGLLNIWSDEWEDVGILASSWIVFKGIHGGVHCPIESLIIGLAGYSLGGLTLSQPSYVKSAHSHCLGAPGPGSLWRCLRPATPLLLLRTLLFLPLGKGRLFCHVDLALCRPPGPFPSALYDPSIPALSPFLFSPPSSFSKYELLI